MNDRLRLTESAPDPRLTADGESVEPTAGKPAKASRAGRPGASRRRTASPEPDPAASDANSVILRARKLLERLIRTTGYGWRDVDRMINKNRGFTAHLLSKREGLPLNELLAILDAIDVRYEDFFAVLFPKFDKPRFKKPVGEGMFDLLGDLGVPEAPPEDEGDRDERTRAIWSRLGRITAMIDQRVLTLMESALSEPLQLPPRAAVRPVEATEPAGATGGPGKPASEG